MTTMQQPAPIVLTGYKEKDREPYRVNVGPKHRKVLEALNTVRRGTPPHEGLTDRELTFRLGLHMAAARRCELRDIGAVRRGGRRNGAWAWVITDKGRELLAQLNEIKQEGQ